MEQARGREKTIEENGQMDLNDIEELRLDNKALKEEIDKLGNHMQQLEDSIKFLKRNNLSFTFEAMKRRRYHKISYCYDRILERIQRRPEGALVRKYHMFNERYYREMNPDLESYEGDLLIHYLQHGWKEFRNPCSDFNTSYYLEHNQDVYQVGMNPLIHYIKFGFCEGRKPTEESEFYKEWVRFQRAESGIIKKLHQLKTIYLLYKKGEFTNSYYMAQYTDARKQLEENKNWKLREKKNCIMKNYGRVRTSPIVHYVTQGVYEGKNPNAMFQTNVYMNSYEDLRRLRYINPFEHYLKFGRNENRIAIEQTQRKNQFINKYISRSFLERPLTLDKSLTIILKYQDDNRFFKCLEDLSEQTYWNYNVIIYHKEQEKEVIDQISRLSSLNINKIIPLDVSCCGMSCIKYAISQATGNFIWVWEEGRLVGNDYLEKMMNAFLCEDIQLVTLSEDGKLYYDTAYEQVPCQGFGSQYGLSEIIFRNPSLKEWFKKESILLETQIGVNRLILKLSSKGFFAHLPSSIDETKDFKEKGFQEKGFLYDDAVHNNVEYIADNRSIRGIDTYPPYQIMKEYGEYLSELYNRYHVDLEKIIFEYERIRTVLLAKTHGGMYQSILQYDMASRLQEKTSPNILISLYSFTHGGGEIMPIRLANQLHDMGYHVYVHVLNNDDLEDKVKAMLVEDILVFYSDKLEEIKEILEAFHIQVIHTHHQALQSFFAEICETYPDIQNNITHIATSHGMYENMDHKTLEYILKTQLQDNIDYWTYVADKNIVPFQTFDVYDSERFYKIQNGMKRPKIEPILRESLGIPNESFVFCLASRALREKGWEYSIECIEKLRQDYQLDVHLILIGEGPVYDQLMKQEMKPYVHLLGFCHNPCDYYAISEACILLSYYKSESAPLAIIEALMSGIPVVATDIGDIRSMITYEEQLAGVLVPLLDEKLNMDKLVLELYRLITDKKWYLEKKELSILQSKTFDIERIANQYINLYEKKLYRDKLYKDKEKQKLLDLKNTQKLLSQAEKMGNSLKVSIIVPNYNHEKFLKQRLDSIYQQSYRNIEVILLDDCSKDDSKTILQKYANQYPDITITVFNEKNSGGVFYQWKKGLELATGDICWIAESDDYADHNFLEKLVPLFYDSKVQLAYCQYEFVNQDGVVTENAYLNYVGNIDQNKWKTSYINDAHEEVRESLSLINCVANASGSLIRRPTTLELFNNKDWLHMRICGDWIFYLHIIWGGAIAYSTETHSYFRNHNNNSSMATYSRPEYYKEHEYVAMELRRLYGVSDDLTIKFHQRIGEFYKCNVSDKNTDYNQLFRLKMALQVNQEKLDNVVTFPVESKEPRKTVIFSPLGHNISTKDLPIEEKLTAVGHNTGNLLFIEAMKEQLKEAEVITFDPIEFNSVHSKDCNIVMPSSNFIIRKNEDIANMIDPYLNKMECPFTLAGLGSQADHNSQTPKELVRVLTPKNIWFLKEVSERAISIGIRGEFTAGCLEELGIYNYRIIGCPSMYFNMDGRFHLGKLPSKDRVLMNVTAGNPLETKIVHMGMDINANWIMQMGVEFSELMENPIAIPVTPPHGAYPELKTSQKDLSSYMKEKAKIFFSISEWNQFIQDNDFTFSFGSRFHGNVSALRNGVPALWIIHDSRTKELVEAMHLPHIDYNTFDKVKFMDELIEYCDYTDFSKSIFSLTKNYVQFLEENGFEHNFTLL